MSNKKCNVFTSNFGTLPLRFTLKGGELFVSKSDLTKIFYEFYPSDYRYIVEELMNKGITQIIGDKSDVVSVVIGESKIGAAIHFHAVGNLLHAYSELIDVDHEILRNSAFQISAFTTWYTGTLLKANNYFGITIEDTLMSVKKRLDRINPPYVVEVMYDVEDNIPAWIGTCDKLHLVTEGRTYEELQQRVWEIAPEMHELQGYGSESDNIRLAFIQTESHADFQRLEM